MHSIKKRIWNIVEDFKRFEWLQFCLKEKCKNYDLYLKIKDIFLNCKSKVIVNYVKNFLSDYCKMTYHLILILVLMKKNQIVKI